MRFEGVSLCEASKALEREYCKGQELRIRAVGGCFIATGRDGRLTALGEGAGSGKANCT